MADDNVLPCDDYNNCPHGEDVDCETSFEVTLPSDRRRWYVQEHNLLVDEGGGFEMDVGFLRENPRWLADRRIVNRMPRTVLEEIAAGAGRKADREHHKQRS
ncbi:hypothetical protein ACFWOG_03420 [Kitasatospora sp. NPDC058406]|uniref:hypothetical protein n=1 Tax=Kitasatospora sp. NPDC058406 TaxID=3346483 RepID=UPI00364A8CBD